MFSSATLHWCKADPGGVLETVKWLLQPGGTFVYEFGGFGNVYVCEPCVPLESLADSVVLAYGPRFTRCYGREASTRSRLILGISPPRGSTGQ